jgi:hypothetical protein
VAISFIVTVIVIGAVFYYEVESWGYGDAIYFCVITTTGVGFGDLTPTTDRSR